MSPEIYGMYAILLSSLWYTIEQLVVMMQTTLQCYLHNFVFKDLFIWLLYDLDINNLNPNIWKRVLAARPRLYGLRLINNRTI